MVRIKRTYTTPKTTTITKRRKKLAKEEEEDDTPLTGIFCLKQRQDMKIAEEKEDCFILDFDPNDSFDSEKLSSSENPESDDDVAIVHEKGQVACRDYPHPRHLCLKYPFGSTNHQLHCNNVRQICATVMYVMWLRLAHIGRLLLTNRIVKHRRKEGGTVYGSFTASEEECGCSPL
ncbi:hypothetical protein IGI04_001731 [Brassica rapa subsp. trilocularis]|uniref:Uncharacterized protein n=1 Tax=Brassica rapa subsp. trilocularis TaxID=1813537 RepID=A0ABQ7NWS5_BRACM|nr:hypothetical protein IGI04_001731 [Brassica rapa subsp. trilocularis]